MFSTEKSPHFSAYDAYVAFHHLMGRGAVDASISNLDMIKHLCSGYDEPQAIRPATHAHFRQTDGSSDEGPVVSGGGNLIGSSGQSLTVPTTSRQVVV